MSLLMSLKLFDNNLASPTLIRDITNEVSGLRFSTILHGGFGIASFDLAADINEAWYWRTHYFLHRLVIHEKDYTVFEGRLEDMEFIKSGLRATFFGYYSNLGDVANDGTATEAGNADVIIKSWLTEFCAQISADQTNIQATDIALANVCSIDDTLLSALDKLSRFSDSTLQTWYFAIWEDRVPYFFPRSISTVDWLVFMGDIESMSLRVSAKLLWNAVYTVYDVAGTATRTGVSTNADSVTKYGVTRRKAISDVGTVAQAAAENQRDWQLVETQELYQQTDRFSIAGSVHNSNGVRFPNCRIRAGDVIRIQDLVPASADVTTVARDALRTFYVKETEYDADTGVVTIIPDTESLRLESVLAKEL